MKKNEKENHIKNKPDKTNKGILSGLLIGAGLVAAGGKIIFDNIKKKEKNNNNKEEESVLKNSIENNNKQFKSKDNDHKKKINKILEKLLENNLVKNKNLILPNNTNVEIDKNLLLCPLSNKIITDPVITPENITYEKNSLLNYLEKNKCEPKAKRKINKNEVIPNFIIIPIIYNYQKKLKK